MNRLTFMCFLNLDLACRVPDAKPICFLRSKLDSFLLTRKQFEQFKAVLMNAGFIVRKGQIVGVTIIRVPVQRNTQRREMRQLKQAYRQLRCGAMP